MASPTEILTQGLMTQAIGELWNNYHDENPANKFGSN